MSGLIGRARAGGAVMLARACCVRDGCGCGAGHATYQDASAERLAHLNQHILAEG